jgi:glycopeptide antibiotics resistance protein
VLLVIGVTIFPIPIFSGSNGMTLLERTVFILSRVQWVPFHYFSPHLSRVLVLEVLGNILLTIPFGFGINFLTSIKGQKILSLALSVGFLIEICQLLVSLLVGVAYRTVDVSDVILNASGVIIGYVLFRFFSWLYVSILRMFNLKPEGLFEYVFQMSRR